MPIGNVGEDEDRVSNAVLPPQVRRPYSAPFLRRLDFSDTGGKAIRSPHETTGATGPS